ncbi:MAG: DMT family transporter [Desulfobacterales bacterium]|nr:MAG: DMT family transporter [Desulfobacterales bacterium]UCD89936.1 MAG: DMT family transporter [Desulfobacterales bacterium]
MSKKTLASKRILNQTALAGPLLMLTAAFLFAVLDGLIKALGPSFRVWDIAFYRFGCGLVILLAVFGWRKNPFSGHNTRLLIIRGITGCAAFLSLVTAIRLIPMSTAMVLFYSFPAFAALLSPLIFKEAITKVEIICVFIALCGVVILFDFSLEGTAFGQVMGVVAGFFAGLTVAIIKKLRDKNGPVTIYLYFCLLGTVITLPSYVAAPQIPTIQIDWLIVSGIVFISIIAQLLMNQGFKYCKSWEGGLFLTSELIFTTIIGIVLFSEIVTWRFWVGSFLVFASAVLINRSNTLKNAVESIHDTSCSS